MAKKERLDVLLVEKNLFSSREKARAAIMAGLVSVDGLRSSKPGNMVSSDAEITVKSEEAFVSRGGKKLDKALDVFNIDVTGYKALDAGASTGGFTDCLLIRGAAKVYAVDVGYGQLAWNLRNDPRVVCMERTNIRYVTKEHIPEPLDFAVADLSFISLGLVLGPIRKLLKQGAGMVCLIKPQFEAGREKVGKKGVVRNPDVHVEVISGILEFLPQSGFTAQALTFSPIKGPQGNIEYLLFISAESAEPCDIDIKSVVDEAFLTLGK